MSDATLAPTGRPGRSLRVPLLVGLALVSSAAVYAGGLPVGRAAGLIAVAGGLLWFPVYFLLRREVQQAADLPDDQLDEREIVLRDRSYLSAYRLLGGALAVSLLLAIVDDAVDARVVENWLNPLAAMLLLSVVLPSVVLAVSRTDHDDAAE